MTEPASGLKRLLDYKLLFDCLADEKSGKISVHTLSARWPKESESQGMKLTGTLPVIVTQQPPCYVLFCSVVSKSSLHVTLFKFRPVCILVAMDIIRLQNVSIFMSFVYVAW